MRVRGSTWPSGQSGIMLLATGGSPRFVFVLRRGASRFFGQWSVFFACACCLLVLRKWHTKYIEKNLGHGAESQKLTQFSSSKNKTTSFDTRPTSTSKVFNSTPHLITLASVHQPTQSDPTSTFLTRLLLSISNYTQQWCSVKNVAKYCLKRSLSPRTVRPPRDTVYIQ